MNGGLDFVLFGVPVRVMWMFFFFMVIFGASFSDPDVSQTVGIALWVAIAFVSILAHEFGHALVYRAFGVQPTVVLHGFGGLTFGRSLPVAKDLVVTLAGPLTGLAIGLPLAYVGANVHISDPTVAVALGMAVFINVFWSLLNLLPVMPLDGGNALNAFLALVTRRDLTRVTRVISIITAAVLVGFALKYQMLFAAMLAGFFIFQNVQALIEGGRGRFAPNVTMPPRPGATPPPPPPPPSGDAPAPADAPGGGPTWSPTMPERPPTADPGADPGGDDRRAAAWTQPQVGPRRRTFGQEVEATAQALARNEPELASIAVDRAARLAVSPEDAMVVQQLRDEVLRRLTSG